MGKEDFSHGDLEEALKRAFVDNGFYSIRIDGQECRSDFKREGINYGVSQGWLEVGKNIEEEQSGAVDYVLTEKGKKHFEIN